MFMVMVFVGHGYVRRMFLFVSCSFVERACIKIVIFVYQFTSMPIQCDFF